MLTHTYSHTATSYRSLPALSPTLTLTRSLSLSLSCRHTKSLRVRRSLRSHCACLALLQFLVAASLDCFLRSFVDVDGGVSVGIGNLAAANKMFICYLLKTILNKIQTMCMYCTLALTHSFTCTHSLACSCTLSATLSFSCSLSLWLRSL